jgi:hypothetical protein
VLLLLLVARQLVRQLLVLLDMHLLLGSGWRLLPLLLLLKPPCLLLQPPHLLLLLLSSLRCRQACWCLVV